MGGAAALTPSLLSLTSCQKTGASFGIKPSNLDDLILPNGLNYDVLLRWGDRINSTDTFGYNNDYTALVSLGKDRALLWVNHEYIHPLFVSGYTKGVSRTKEQVDKEMYDCGGSIVEIKRNTTGQWEFVKDSKFNRRITAKTKIPFAADVKVAGSSFGTGTFGNCAGGITPWGTILTCEENYDGFVGEIFHDGKKEPSRYGWEKFSNDHHPHFYGWVVEVNPKTGEAKKHTSIGRYAHECCTLTTGKDGRVVAYSGDDRVNEFIYKFVSDTKNSLDKGELFVADIVNGKWLSLDINKNQILKDNFKTQLDIQIHCRKAARLIGATPCDRPEDIEIHPTTGEVFVALTNNYNRRDMKNPKNNFYGKVLKIIPENGDHGSLSFKTSDILIGGEESGVACPDNLAFDKLGNLWVTTDMSGSMMNKPPYTKFKNNGLFYFPLSGKHAGQAIQIASAPMDAELTGITFSDDYKTLFMAVQHPGEKTRELSAPTSTWPDGKGKIPRPAVVQISGPLLDKLMS
jgi:secreted PhoX family phosphatase